MVKQHIYKFGFTLENTDGSDYRECTARFYAYPSRKGTRDEPPEAAFVEWLTVIVEGGVFREGFGSQKTFEIFARGFSGNPQFSLSDFDDEALQLADDYNDGKREDVMEAKAEARREARIEARMEALEATTRGDN